MSALVLAPHADDEVLGCGGTIAKHVAAGVPVAIVIMTAPVTQGPGTLSLGSAHVNKRYAGQDDPAGAALGRLADARIAAATLGATITLLSYPEVATEAYSLTEMVGVLEAQLDSAQPETVYVPHWADMNQDHRHIFSAASIALRSWQHRNVRRVLAYHVDHVSHAAYAVADTGRVYVDITEYFFLKKTALSAYASELRPAPHPRSLAGVEITARAIGLKCGVDYAEEFTLVWERA